MTTALHFTALRTTIGAVCAAAVLCAGCAQVENGTPAQPRVAQSAPGTPSGTKPGKNPGKHPGSKPGKDPASSPGPSGSAGGDAATFCADFTKIQPTASPAKQATFWANLAEDAPGRIKPQVERVAQFFSDLAAGKLGTGTQKALAAVGKINDYAGKHCTGG